MFFFSCFFLCPLPQCCVLLSKNMWGKIKLHLTFTLVLIPGVDTVLHAITHQCVVYAHVAVAEEGICFTWSWKSNGKNIVIKASIHGW